MGPLRVFGISVGSVVLYFFLRFCTIEPTVALFFAIGAFLVGVVLFNENPSWAGPRYLEWQLKRERRYDEERTTEPQ